MDRTFKIKDYENAPLMIECKIGGRKCLAIVDTGADVSICDEKFVMENGIPCGKKQTFSVAGVGETANSTSRPFDTTIAFKDYKWRHYSFKGKCIDLSQLQDAARYITDEPLIAIIGTDWLEQHKAIINIEDKTLTIEPR